MKITDINCIKDIQPGLSMLYFNETKRLPQNDYLVRQVAIKQSHDIWDRLAELQHKNIKVMLKVMGVDNQTEEQMTDYTQDIKNIQLTISKLYADMANMERDRTHVLRGAANYLSRALDELDSYIKATNREKNDRQPIK